MSDSARSIGAARARPGLLVPTLAFGLHLMSSAAAGVLLVVGHRAYALTAGWTALAGSAAVTAVALAATVGAVMAGTRLGRVRAPLAALAIVQAAFGLSVLASPLLLKASRALYLVAWPHLADWAVGTWVARLGIAVAVMALPAALFGAMPPLLSRLISDGRDALGLGLGFSFGLTLAGLGFGLGLSGVVLLPALGMAGTLFMTVALSGLAAAGMVLLRQAGLEGPGAIAAALEAGDGRASLSPPAPSITGSPSALGAGMALFGFAAWGYFVAWERTLAPIVGGTMAARALVGAAFAVGLAIGAFVVAGIVDRIRAPLLALTALVAGAALMAAATMHLVPGVALLYLRLTPFLARPALAHLPAFLGAAALMLPAALLIGGALPLLPLAALARGRAMVGTLVFLAFGIVLADLVVPLHIIPSFGVRRALSLACAVGLLAAILFLGFAAPRARAARATVGLALLGLMFLVGGFPASWDPRIVASGLYRYGAGSLSRFGTVEEYVAARRTVEPIFYREGRESTVMLERTLSGPSDALTESLALTEDGKIEATTGADMRAQILTAHLPLLAHGPADSVLLVDFMSGVTAGSLLRHPIVTLAVIESEPAVLEAADFLIRYNQNPLQDSRLTSIADSGRARLLADTTQYDVIVLPRMEPWLAPNAALATREGYALLKARLRPGGVVARRVQLSAAPETAQRANLRAFAEAFEATLLFRLSEDDCLLLGSGGPLLLDIGWIRNVISSSTGVSDDLRRAGVLGPNDLAHAFRLDRPGVLSLAGDAPRNDDDRPFVELASASQLQVHRNETLAAAIEMTRTPVLPHLTGYGTLPKEKSEFLYNLAKSYLGLAADPVRARDIARLLADRGESGMAGWILGEARFQERDIDGALEEWHAVLAREPRNLDALFSLGTFYLDGRDFVRAEPFLARAALAHSEVAVVRYHHGRNLYSLGRYREAIPELEAARRLGGDRERYPLVDYLVGVASRRLDRPKEAALSLETYLEWAYAQNTLTQVEVDAHLKLAEAYDQQGKRYEAHKQRQKGEDLMRRIQAYAASRRQAAPPAPSGPSGNATDGPLPPLPSSPGSDTPPPR